MFSVVRSLIITINYIDNVTSKSGELRAERWFYSISLATSYWRTSVVCTISVVRHVYVSRSPAILRTCCFIKIHPPGFEIDQSRLILTQAWKQTSGDPSGQTWNFRGISNMELPWHNVVNCYRPITSRQPCYIWCRQSQWQELCQCFCVFTKQ